MCLCKEKVKNLAHRGLTANQMLNLCERLGTDIMPHFDALRSTTEELLLSKSPKGLGPVQSQPPHVP